MRSLQKLGVILPFALVACRPTPPERPPPYDPNPPPIAAPEATDAPEERSSSHFVPNKRSPASPNPGTM
jgi:hypothetical protein